MRPPLRVYKSNTLHAVAVAIGVVFFLLAIASIIVAATDVSKTATKICITSWTVLPSLYFFVEYYFLFDNIDDEKATTHMKRLQDLASRLWAGVLALLITLYLQ